MNKKINKRSNRQAGHATERKEAAIWRALGFKSCKTSRYSSREMDDKKVDLVGTGSFYVQIKNSCTTQDYHKILSSMPQEEKINLLVHVKTQKSKGGKFMAKGKYVTLNAQDFYDLLLLLLDSEHKLDILFGKE